MLDLNHIHVAYGDVGVLGDISLRIEAGQVVSVVGANGAGKTTLLKAIAGLLRPRAGTIVLEGRRLDSLPTHTIVELGLVRVPEGRKLFPDMTVLENLYLGSYLKAARRQRQESLARVFEFFPILKERARQLAGTLSGGEQQMLAIGRGLMALPRLLMLDEPSLGLAPLIVQEIFTIIQDINRNGVTILLVEQNVFRSLSMSHWGYVLENGQLVLQGQAEQLLADEHIKTAYLGI